MTQQRAIAVVTGTRAEFGLLKPVMRAIEAERSLRLQAIVTGSHLLPPASTADDVRAAFPVHAEISMQRPSETGRMADAIALGRGVEGLARQFERDRPDVVLVLGDRIEAFAAAAAASIAGIRVAHIHGGDRAEGIADEAMRHAISKLAHIHFPASEQSAERLKRMGEDASRIFIVGSPAIDGLADMPAMNDETFASLGRPEIVFLMHPCGRADNAEHVEARLVLAACCEAGRVLAMHPNHDPGREGIVSAISEVAAWTLSPASSLPREAFVGLLRRVKCMVGNSSAGLIECAALGLPVVNVGMRQHGRERSENVHDVPTVERAAVSEAIQSALTSCTRPVSHPYGDGHAGRRIAEMLARFDPEEVPGRKLNSY